eukprot:TRINITY_DN160_c1_g2_i1.p1 TRINITY_DN160_c1_g2~~TRINITY_DN160_c1_g2_i1.p1  ORF type:complete len:151 (+),score=24.91 TRINITY_DN160_c1_g2_i1:64-453(+)
MDPGWLIVYLFLVAECVVVALLIMPMPSNYVRGKVVGGLRAVWNKYPNLRHGCALLLLLNSYYCWVSISSLNSPPDSDSVHARTKLFRDQRNAYITTFGIGMFFIMHRLLDLHDQLFVAREAEKREKAK